jgi:hypothetical protein
MNEAWPVTGPVDDKLIQMSQYLITSAHDFRVRLKQLTAPGKGKKFIKSFYLLRRFIPM